MKKDLSNQVAATYKMLRLGLAVLALAFPPLLWAGGYTLADLPLEGSMSAYYHASDPQAPDAGAPGAGPMRNEFVGILFAVGILLFAYQGFTRMEDWALNLAGLLAWGVALFPMKWPAVPNDSSWSLHGAIAVAFFFCIAYVCIFRAGDTLPLIQDPVKRRWYQRIYRLLGLAMVICPVAAWVLISFLPLRKSTIFFVELAGIYVFAAYWMVKSHEAVATGLDEKATQGRLQVAPHGVTDLLRQVPVTEK